MKKKIEYMVFLIIAAIGFYIFNYYGLIVWGQMDYEEMPGFALMGLILEMWGLISETNPFGNKNK